MIVSVKKESLSNYYILDRVVQERGFHRVLNKSYIAAPTTVTLNKYISSVRTKLW